MSQKEIFVKNEESWEITPYGEFVSYHHAHNKILNNLLDLQVASDVEINSQKQKIKKFLKQNIKKVDHFVEYSQEIASFVSMTEEEFNKYMMDNFIEVLKNIQEEMKQQFVHNFEFENKNKYFNSRILDGILENIKIKEFDNYQFLLNKDGNFYIEDSQSGEKIESKSISKAASLQTIEVLEDDLPEIQPSQIKEQPILADIIAKFGDKLNGQTLTLKNTIEQIPQLQEEKKSLISDVDDFDFEEEDSQEDNVSIGEEDLEKEISSNESFDSEENESSLETKDESFTEKINQDKNKEDENIISLIEYMQLSNLNLKNKRNGVEPYKKWLISLEKEKLGIIFIEDQLGKNISEHNWDNAISKISKQVNLGNEKLIKIKKLISLLFNLKRELEMFLNLCKKDHSETIPVFQKIWNDFLKIINDSVNNYIIDFNNIEVQTLNLLEQKEKNEILFVKIFRYWLENRLKKKFNQVDF